MPVLPGEEPQPSRDPGQAHTSSDVTPGLVSGSAAMQRVLLQARRFAATTLPVLITGEAGTGKRLLARVLHEYSRQRSGPFSSLHCGITAASSIAIELFGSEKGLFPGAERRHGLCERLVGGTLFLDEVEHLPDSAQAPLLRMLETGDVVRLGGREALKTNTRLITGVTCAAPDAIAAPQLLQNLYYRLSVLRLHLPPLRERQDDIAPLAQALLRQLAGQLGRRGIDFAPTALAGLTAHSWPGNGRELISVVQRAAVMASGDRIEVDDLHFEEPAHPAGHVAHPPVRPEPGSVEELNLLVDTLNQTRFNLSRTARELNVSRVTLYRMLHRNHIELRQNWEIAQTAGDRDPARTAMKRQHGRDPAAQSALHQPPTARH